MSIKRKKSEKRGRQAEWLACLFLLLKGYFPKSFRFRSKRGEVDLICRRGNTIIFVEVKARKSVDDAKHAVSYKQQQRIVAASEDWLKLKPQKSRSLRFDMVAIAPGKIPTHIKDAWRPNQQY